MKFSAPECAPIAVLGGGAGIGCGTSMSAPLVSGIVGLMRTQAPFATAEEIETRLAGSARAIPGAVFGVPDAAAALRRLGSPEPRLRPVVLGGAAVAATLEAFSGIWVGSGLNVTYHWERCLDGNCTAIASAASSRYTPTEDDRGHSIRVVVTAQGLNAVASAQTRIVESRPRLLTRPSLHAQPRVGARIVARVGRWTGENLRYRVGWQRCKRTCEDVANGRSYRVHPGDRGYRLRVLVQASNSVGVGAALSNTTRIVR